MATSPNPFDQFDAPAAAAANPFDQFDEKPPSMLEQVGRQAGLAGRAVIQGLVGLPGMAADAVTAAGNLATGHIDTTNWKTLLFGSEKAAREGAMQSPSTAFNQALTKAGLPEPQSWQEKTAGILESALTGSQVPLPKFGAQAPKEFVSPKEVQAQVTGDVVRKAQDQGLVVPPATANPSVTNRTLETIAGKLSTQQTASGHNQPALNAIAKDALGINPDAPLTPEAFPAIRTEAAAEGYEPIRAAGTLQAPPSFHERLVAALSKYRGAERSFPGMGKTDLADIVEKVDRPQFDAGDAIDLTKILRDKADTAFRAGDTGTGQGMRQISDAVEKAIDEGLQAKGPEYADALANFRDARKTIAISHTIEDAVNPGTGNVVASKLAAALKRGEPLSGPLKDAARFAASFPKAVQEPVTSNVNHLDIYAPMMSMLFGHGLAEKAAGFAVPAARASARYALFSPWGQAGAVPSFGAAPSAAVPQALLGARQALQ